MTAPILKAMAQRTLLGDGAMGFKMGANTGRFIRFEFIVKQQGKLFSDFGAVHDDAFPMNKRRDSDP